MGMGPSKGKFTVSKSISVCRDTNKWVHLTSMELFTCNDAKHERKKDANADAHCE